MGQAGHPRLPLSMVMVPPPCGGGGGIPGVETLQSIDGRRSKSTSKSHPKQEAICFPSH